MITKFDVRKIQGKAYKATLGRVGSSALERGNAVASRNPRAVRTLFRLASRFLPVVECRDFRRLTFCEMADGASPHTYRGVVLGPWTLFYHRVF